MTIIPFEIWDSLLEFLKGLVSSPLGYLRIGLQIPCLALCWVPSEGGILSSTCSFTGVIMKLGDLVETVVGAYNSWPAKVADPYCSQIEDKKVETPPAEDKSVTTAEAQTASS